MTGGYRGVFFDMDGVVLDSSCLWEHIITAIKDSLILLTTKFTGLMERLSKPALSQRLLPLPSTVMTSVLLTDPP